MTARAAMLAALAVVGCGRADRGIPRGDRGDGSQLAGRASNAFAAPGAPVARLQSGDVDLWWQHRAVEDGGTWIELATPGEAFLKIDARWPGDTTFRHQAVAPGTTFHYRLVPFFGRPSPVVVVALPAADETGAVDDLVEGPLTAAATGRGAGAVSLRSAATIAAAAPDRLSAVVSSSTTVDLRWRDRAGDEDGYLVEASRDGVVFAIAAVLPPDTVSFRKASLATGASWRFRVRAFFDGESSPPVEVTTPVSPS
jgi:hypothetical protein